MASPVPAKSQPLHNFSLPHLKWKNHRKQSPIRHHHHHSDQESADVMTNQRKRSSSSSSSRICIKVTSSHVVSTSASEAIEDESSLLQKTWNLRPRRPVMNHNNNNNNNGGVMKIGSSSMTENKSVNGNSSNNFSTNKEVMDFNDTVKKQRFAIALTRDEIEEDIFMLTGMKPARRPKKRPRNVQKQLDTLFPGLWLGSITADSYKVSENPPKV